MTKKVLNAAYLELSMVKVYMKSLCFMLIVPILFVLLNRSMETSVSFAMCFTAMTSSYGFTVAEKNDMDRLYGIIPLSRKEMVLGKYIFMLAFGAVALIFSLVTHTLVLRLLSVTVSGKLLFMVGLEGCLLFTIYIVCQIPGYYKFGAINGKIFMYIPVLGFLVTLFLIQKLNDSAINKLNNLLKNGVLCGILVLLFCIVLYAISAILSVRILEKKEL